MRPLIILLALAAWPVFADDQVILFYRDGCGPCAKAKSAILSDPSLLGDVELALVDTQKHPLLTLRYRVSAVPVFVFERDRTEVARQVGWNGEAAFKAWLRSTKRGKK